MSERVVDRVGVGGVVAIAAATILAYSLWGSMLLEAQRQAGFSGSPEAAIAANH